MKEIQWHGLIYLLHLTVNAIIYILYKPIL